MFRPAVFSTIAIAAVLLGPLAAREPRAEDALPPAAAASLAENRAICAPKAVRLERGFVTRKDIDGDGVPDVILDYGHFLCAGSSGEFCGSAGCLSTVFVSARGAWRKVLDENVQALRFKTVKGRPAMVVSRAGSACGRANAESCDALEYLDGKPR